MIQIVQHERYGAILYEEGFWLGRKSLTINGVPLQKLAKKQFQLPDGGIATLKGNFYTAPA